jgi:two-component system, NtrC family, response regulator GlrR
MPKHILLIDDEKSVREILKEALTIHGYRVTAVETAFEAMKVARAEKPDLVMTDLQLEDSDGFAIINEMKTIHPLVPILLLTGAILDAKAVKAKVGDKIAGLIPKTTRLETILQEVKKITGQ